MTIHLVVTFAVPGDSVLLTNFLSAAHGGNCEVISVDNLLLSLHITHYTDNVGVVMHYETVTDSAFDALVQYINGTCLLIGMLLKMHWFTLQVMSCIGSEMITCSCCDQLCKSRALSDPGLAIMHLKAIYSSDLGK